MSNICSSVNPNLCSQQIDGYRIDSLTILPDSLNVGAQHKTLKNLFILVIIIFITIVSVIVAWILYYSWRKSIPQDTGEVRQVDVSTLQLPTTGSSIDGRVFNGINGSAYKDRSSCIEGINTEWQGGRCTCKTGYWGPRCRLQAHSFRYNVAGELTEPINVINQFQTARQAFTEDSCETACEENTDCLSYVYDYDPETNQGTCYLSDEIPSTDFNFNLSTNNVFIKRSAANDYTDGISRPFFTDVVIFYQRIFRWPPLSRDKFLKINYYSLALLDFVPTNIINDGDAIIAYSADPFTIADVYNGNTKIYIHKPGQNFMLPPLNKHFHRSLDGNFSVYVMALSYLNNQNNNLGSNYLPRANNQIEYMDMIDPI